MHDFLIPMELFFQNAIQSMSQEGIFFCHFLVEQEEDLFKQEFSQANADYPSKFYCPSQLEFESIVKRYFIIEDIFFPQACECGFHEQLYLLRKKGGK